jgi:hypothetical protein
MAQVPQSTRRPVMVVTIPLVLIFAFICLALAIPEDKDN